MEKNEQNMELIGKKLQELNDLKSVHIKMYTDLLDANNGNILIHDLVATGMFNRSLHLIDGFSDLIKNFNLLCAATFIRMQLDNSIRFNAIFLIDDVKSFIKEFLAGKSIRDFKDKSNGQKLYDNYLVKKLGEEFAWIIKVYDESSGFIHFSNKHMFATIVEISSEERSVTNKISSDDSHVPIEFVLELIGAMKELTEVLLYLLSKWNLYKSKIVIN